MVRAYLDLSNMVPNIGSSHLHKKDCMREREREREREKPETETPTLKGKSLAT